MLVGQEVGFALLCQEEFFEGRIKVGEPLFQYAGGTGPVRGCPTGGKVHAWVVVTVSLVIVSGSREVE